MFLILITVITLVNCLEPKQDNKIDEEIKKVINKYVNKIPDVEPQYVIHEGLSNIVSRYFKEKITTFPLYKISLKLDRNPVKIPWTLIDPNTLPDPKTLADQVISARATDNEVGNKTSLPKVGNIKTRTYKYVPDSKKE